MFYSDKDKKHRKVDITTESILNGKRSQSIVCRLQEQLSHAWMLFFKIKTEMNDMQLDITLKVVIWGQQFKSSHYILLMSKKKFLSQKNVLGVQQDGFSLTGDDVLEPPHLL